MARWVDFDVVRASQALVMPACPKAYKAENVQDAQGLLEDLKQRQLVPEGSTAFIKAPAGGELRWQRLQDNPDLPTEGRLQVLFQLPSAAGSACLKVCPETPSTVCQSGLWARWAPDSPADPNAQFLGYRPLASDPPMSLPACMVVHEAGLFLEELDANPPLNLPAGIRGLLLALNAKLPRVFEDEAARRHAVTHIFNKHLSGLGGHSIQTSSYASSKKDYLDDGSVVLNLKHGTVLLFLQVVKDEPGTGGDPFYQGMRYYQAFWSNDWREKTSDYFRFDPCPAVLLEVVGNTMRVSLLACIHAKDDVVQVMAEPLSPFFHFADLPQPAYIKRLQAFLWALDRLLERLRRRYVRLTKAPSGTPGARLPSVQLPYPLRDTEVFSQVKLVPSTKWQYEAKYLHAKQDVSTAEEPTAAASHAAAQSPAGKRPLEQGSVAQPPGKRAKTVAGAAEGPRAEGVSSDMEEQEVPPALHTVNGDDTWKNVRVKFTTEQYAIEVHQAWAAHGLAPQLYAWAKLPGGMYMVVMEQLDPSAWTNLHRYDSSGRPCVARVVRQALEMAHSITLPSGGKAAHGDCRKPNIMVKGEGENAEVKFVDFEWAGEEGKRLYPLNMSDDIMWPEGASPCKPLMQAHDVAAVAANL